jgi:hypothetical protein
MVLSRLQFRDSSSQVSETNLTSGESQGIVHLGDLLLVSGQLAWGPSDGGGLALWLDSASVLTVNVTSRDRRDAHVYQSRFQITDEWAYLMVKSHVHDRLQQGGAPETQCHI